MKKILLQNCRIDNIKNLYQQYNVELDVLRLDLVHPHVSGNKWYKLKNYLEAATEQKKSVILTFGGAFSNHIIATAAACKMYGFQSIGIIRGEKPEVFSHTLQEALDHNMYLFFTSREDYKLKKIPTEVFSLFNKQDVFIINEGGYGKEGANGIESIAKEIDLTPYTEIFCAVGTGTTLAGFVAMSGKEQQIAGISAMKNNNDLQQQVNDLLPQEKKDKFKILHDFHFGGYAKHTPKLISFMNNFFEKSQIPTDFVYTGKLFYAVDYLIKNHVFKKANKILIVHSGGLQGNRSLPKGTLIF